MPIYEYRCGKCNTVFEEWHKQADDVMEEPCPECHAPAHRQISNTSFVLKGGGWYVTEYGNRKADTPSTPSATAPSSESSSTPSSETKTSPEPTATTPPAASPAPSQAAD